MARSSSVTASHTTRPLTPPLPRPHSRSRPRLRTDRSWWTPACDRRSISGPARRLAEPRVPRPSPARLRRPRRRTRRLPTRACSRSTRQAMPHCSPSPRTSRHRSLAASTERRTPPATLRRAIPHSTRDGTPSPCGPPTRPATSTRARPVSGGAPVPLTRQTTDGSQTTDRATSAIWSAVQAPRTPGAGARYVPILSAPQPWASCSPAAICAK